MSAAGTDGAWAPDETVEVTLTFSEAVTVDSTDGTPSVEVSLGGSAATERGVCERQRHG